MKHHVKPPGDHGIFKYRAAILGCPSQPDVAWSKANLLRLQELGFNTTQLNIAWGGRPADEPLNLEDLVSLPSARLEALQQPDLPARSVPERRGERREQLAQRIAMAKEAGLRTLFHFGAPYNAQYGNEHDLNGRQLRSLLDQETTLYYTELLAAFAADFAGVDDILVYTYDQDAWLTSEFGSCWRTRGHDLASRVVPFLEKLAQSWAGLSPEGLLWWSPWELSAGQVYRCVTNLRAPNIGLDLHPNVAETMLTLPVDRWLRNTVQLAGEKGIPVMVESFLSSTSEETEPYQYLMHPHATVRQVKSLAALPSVVGLKEYYGLDPSKWDPNLEAASRAMMDPAAADEDLIIPEIARQAGDAAEPLAKAWRLFSTAQEFFPWDLSWWVRELGTADVSHSLDAAGLRGAQVPTPSWESTRRAIFMKNNDDPPHPWMLEDVQIRWEFSEKYFTEGLGHLREAILRATPAMREVLGNTLRDTEHMLRRIKAYRFHCRQTNIVGMMRQFKADGRAIPDSLVVELRELLQADLENQQAADAGGAVAALQGAAWIWDAPHTGKNTKPWAPRFFRKRFEIPAGENPVAADLVCTTSDRWVRLSVNGRPVENFGSGPPPYKTSIGHLLRRGSNEITLRMIKAGSLYENPACCCAVAMEQEDGSEWLGSDETWESSRVADFSAPTPAVVVGRYGDLPLRQQGSGDGGVRISEALRIFERDFELFLDRYFQVVPDKKSHGLFSVTSC